MDCIIDDIQSGCGFNKAITCDQLILAAQTKSNNMVKDKTWSKVDPHNAKIMALRTKLEQLEKSQGGGVKPDAAAHGTILNNGGGKLSTGNTKIEEGRKKFDASTKEVGGLTYQWCKQHKTKDYEGLYVSSHLPDQHGAWAQAKKEGNCGNFLTKPMDSSKSSNSTSKPSNSAKKSTLGPNDRLKQVLMLKACLSTDDVDCLFKEAEENKQAQNWEYIK